MKKFILDILFPVRCLVCGKEGKFICSRCLKRIPPGANPQKDSPSVSRAALVPVNPACQNSLKKIIAAADYKHPLVKNLIHRYKYDFVRELSEPLGALMAKKLISSSPSVVPASPVILSVSEESIFPSSLNLLFRDHILIPVPLHKKRLRWRGFNQSELLCREISKTLNIAVANDILSRAKNTPPQAKIENLSKRKTNIQNAFILKKHYWGQPPQRGLPPINLKNKTIILVDDITTTGATLRECAKALKPLRPKFIHALVFAR